MGMDVFGTAPRSKHGEYFRRNIWGWHPLAEFCLRIAPDVCAPCKHWHTNDGDGLDNDGAIALSLKLQAAVNTGSTVIWARENEQKQQRGDTEDVVEFIAFLRDCGGFKIC